MTITEAKEQLSLIDDNSNDGFISALIEAATVHAQEYQWSQLVTATWAMRLDDWPCDGVIEVHPNPVQSITSITYKDTSNATATLTEGTHFVTDLYGKPARITPAIGHGWPATYGTPGNIIITFVAGYSSVATIPANVKHAIKLMVGHWFQNREAVGQVGDEVPLAVRSLLDANSFRVMY